MILLAISIHSLVPVLFLANKKNDNWTMMCEFKTSSNPIALKLMVDISFLDHCLSNHHYNIGHATYAHVSGAPFKQCLTVNVFLKHNSLYHLIWQMLSPCSHNCGNPPFWKSRGLSLTPSATPSSSPWFKWWIVCRNSLHSSFPENLTLPSRQFVLHLFFSGILSLSYPDTNQIWISVRYNGWDIFQVS